MKWIGQQIYDQVVRFRNQVFFEADTVTFTSSNADDPTVIIENTAADAQAARLQFKKYRGVDAVDQDNIGEIDFWSYDDGTPSEQQYAKILIEIDDATDGQESGSFVMLVATHNGSLREFLRATGGSVSNETDVVIANGAASLTTISGDLTISGSDLTFDSVALTGIQTSAESFANNDVSLMTSAAIEDKILSYSYTTSTGTITGIRLTTDDTNIASATSGSADFNISGGAGIDTSVSGTTITIAAETASDSNAGVVELATTEESMVGDDSGRAVTPAGLAAARATVQTGKHYRIVNTSFRADIGTDKYYLPLKSQDEQTVLTREENQEVAVCDGRLVSLTWRSEGFNTHTGDATVTFAVETNTVGSSYSGGYSVQETEAVTVNHADDQHLWHVVFDSAKHWDSTDMFTISMQSDTDITGNNERIFITLVIEDDWGTYLAGSTREIDTTP